MGSVVWHVLFCISGKFESLKKIIIIINVVVVVRILESKESAYFCMQKRIVKVISSVGIPRLPLLLGEFF